MPAGAFEAVEERLAVAGIDYVLVQGLVIPLGKSVLQFFEIKEPCRLEVRIVELQAEQFVDGEGGYLSVEVLA